MKPQARPSSPQPAYRPICPPTRDAFSLPRQQPPDSGNSRRLSPLPLSADREPRPSGHLLESDSTPYALRLMQLELELEDRKRERAIIQQKLEEESHDATVDRLKQQLSIEKNTNRECRQENARMQQSLSEYMIGAERFRSRIESTERGAVKAKEEAAAAKLEKHEVQDELRQVSRELSQAISDVQGQSKTIEELLHQLKSVQDELTVTKGQVEAEKDKRECDTNAVELCLKESQREVEKLKKDNHSLFLELGRMEADSRRNKRINSDGDSGIQKDPRPLRRNKSTQELIITLDDSEEITSNSELESPKDDRKARATDTVSREKLDTALAELIDAKCTIDTLEAMKSAHELTLSTQDSELAELRQQLQESLARRMSKQSHGEDQWGETRHDDEDGMTVPEEGEPPRPAMEPDELVQQRGKVGELQLELQQMKEKHQELLGSFLQQIQHTMEIESQKEDLQMRLEEALRCAADRDIPNKSTSTVSYTEVKVNAQKILGTGAWGYVVEGCFRGKTVAVKCLHSSIVSNFTVAHLQREIEIMADLRHPNLVLFIAAAMDAPSGPIIVTELLTKTLRMAYMDESIASCKLFVLHDVACALSYLHLHQKPIIHRDVSSSNVLLEELPDRKWRGKLSDFGSANLARLAATPGSGAAVYASPEMSTNIEQTPAVDVYSYGVLMCEVTTGVFPVRDQWQDMLSLTQAQWPDTYDIVRSCTQERPEDRLNMATLIAKLDSIIKAGTIY